MNPRPRIGLTRNALTLVELLAALTLSAMIMAVLFGLVAKLSLARDVLKEQKPFEPWKSILKDQLRRDYVGCRSVLVSAKRIRMDGYAEFIDYDGQRRTGPCTTEYYIVAGENENWVFREQRNILLTPPDSVRKELVCRSISNFRSLDELSTDVAPGVLRIKLSESSTTSIQTGDSANPRSGNSQATGSERAFTVVLLRHGVAQ